MSNKPSTPQQSPRLLPGFKLITPPLKSRCLSSPINLDPIIRRSPERCPVPRSVTRFSHLLNTPEPINVHRDLVPASPSVKRTRSGSIISPEREKSLTAFAFPTLRSPRLRPPDSSPLRLDFSPCSLINHTPMQSNLDDDLEVTPRSILGPPHFLSSIKNTPSDLEPNGLLKISSQLRYKLSSALGKINRSTTIKNNDLRFDPFVPSPTSTSIILAQSPTFQTNSSASKMGTNVNLQTLEPINPHSRHSSPIESKSLLLNREFDPRASPQDDSHSAHDALMAALRRQQRTSSVHEAPHSAPSTNSVHTPSILKSSPSSKSQAKHLPQTPNVLGSSLNAGSNEQDAVLSLMYLSSPQRRRQTETTVCPVLSSLSSRSLLISNDTGAQPLLATLNMTSPETTVDADETDIEMSRLESE